MMKGEEKGKGAIPMVKLSITYAFRRKPKTSVYHLFLESFYVNLSMFTAIIF